MDFRFSIGTAVLTFSLLSLVMIVGAVGVITLKQPVHAALSLVGTLLTLAVTYVTLQAHFLATIQVIVYAGAIMVLFLFVIMLLNIQGEEREERFSWMRPVAYGLAVLAAAGIGVGAFQNSSPLPNPIMIARALGGGGAEQVGGALFTDFILAFQLVGVLLLTGIIGAVSLVQRKAEEAVKAQQQVALATPSRSSGGVAVLERDDKPPINPLASSQVSPQPPRSAPKAPPKENKEPESSPSKQNARESTAPKKEVKAEAPKPEPGVQEKKPEPSSEAAAAEPEAEKDKAASTGPDDLKRIKGVGPKLEQLLNRNGITTFEQIATLNPKEIEELDSKLESFQGRIERDNWIEQAKDLAEEKKNG